MIVRDVAFALAVVLAVVFEVSLFAYKRADVSWSSFLIAGPLTVLKPSRYLRADRARIPPTLFVLAMLMGGVAWIASWAVDNS
jgi:hypothetical protein